MELTTATAALAALGNPTRLSVFRLLVEAGPEGRTPGDIAEALSLPGATLSFHLKELALAGLIAGEAAGRRIRYRDALLELTRYEYALLAALLQRPGAILSRAQLMDRGWDDGADSGDRTVDTHVKTLRAKLRAAGATRDPIRTHRGIGYALDA